MNFKNRIVLGVTTLLLSGSFTLAGPSAAQIRSGRVEAGPASSAATQAAQAAAVDSTVFNPPCEQPSGFNTTYFMEFSVTSSVVGARQTECDIEARCIDSETGLFVQNCTVVWEIEDIVNTGGHEHDDSDRPLGMWTEGCDLPSLPERCSGNTGETGVHTSMYMAPEASGRFKVTLTASAPGWDFGDPTEFDFDIRDSVRFSRLRPSPPDYGVIGETDDHPSNHWGRATLLEGIDRVGNAFRAKYSSPMVEANDMSLNRAGVFDYLPATWGLAPTGSHDEHRFGFQVDVRSQSMSPTQKTQFLKIAHGSGFNNSRSFLEAPGTTNEHFHITLEGSP